ncbi:MAG: hypothetical protein LBB74_06395 [Chitinispirillales bacterium]|jgi:hypothetical protein|nr:hypothetical protein [Chitinispirillales bacterium]
MRFPIIKALSVAAAVTSAASAQFYSPMDARQAGMGGGATIADFYDVYNYPALMFEYQNNISATVMPGGASGGILGIKSLNDRFAVGIAANQGLMANQGIACLVPNTDGGFDTVAVVPSFASTAINSLNGALPAINTLGFTFEPSNLWKTNIPHLLLGFNAGTVKLGADIFVEYSRYNNFEETGADNGTITDSYNGLLLNPGARLSADIDIGDIGLMTKAGLSLPSFEIKEELSRPGAETVINSTKSDKGLYVELGAELAMPVKSFELTAGTFYIFTEHSIKNSQMSYWNSNFSLYAGGEFSFLTTAKASAKYAFSRIAGTTTTTATLNSITYIFDEMVGFHYHSISAGMENVWDKAYFFDSVSLRAGAVYGIVDYVGNYSENRSINKRDWKRFAEHAVIPTMGVGVTKSFLTIDLYCDIGSWNGAFTGPAVGAATATIKF